MLKRILIGVAAVIAIAIIGVTAFGWRSSIAPIAPPAASSFAPAQIAKGEALAGAGYCVTCHTAKGGAAYAGGYAMATPFGTIYSTNITPDAETGIGSWSLAAFTRAMHEGVRRNGGHLFPAFPYDHFTRLSDEDVAALYAFMMTRPAVHAEARSNGLPFPLNLRLLQAGWKWLYFKPGRFVPDTGKDAVWNRGAYLAKGISHCGACHTPRGSLGAELHDKAYSGATIDGWVAPPLDQTNPSPVPWNEDELVAYLGTGVSRYHGVAAGPMGSVPHGLAKLPAADLHAIARYFLSINGAEARAAETPIAISKALAADRIGMGRQYDPAARLYAGACASCHFNSGSDPSPLRPDLALNSALSLDDPTNLIRVILYGIDAKQGIPGVVMPGFIGFSDADIARIAAWLRATRTTKPAWPDLEKRVAAIRAAGKGQE
ncbi:cytochrome c [soil metagenome]